MTKRLPWPAEAGNGYWYIRKMAKKVRQLFTVFIDYGLASQNPAMVDKLLPRIEATAREILLTCRQIQATRNGYWPKWAVTALEDTTVLADEILDYTGQIRAAYRHGNYRLMYSLSTVGHRYGQKIEQVLVEGPPPPEQTTIRELINETFAQENWE